MKPQPSRDENQPGWSLRQMYADGPIATRFSQSPASQRIVAPESVSVIDPGIRATVGAVMTPLDEGRLSSLWKTREKLKASLKWLRKAKTEGSYDQPPKRFASPSFTDGYALASLAGGAALWVPAASYTPLSELDGQFEWTDLRGNPCGGYRNLQSLDVLAVGNSIQDDSVWIEWFRRFGAFADESPRWAQILFLRRLQQAAYASFLEVVRRTALRGLRRVNGCIRRRLRQLEGPQRLHDFIAKNRAFHLLHGSHPPPRLMEWRFFSINLPGVAAN